METPEECPQVIHVHIVGTGTLQGLPNSEPSTLGSKTRSDRGAGRSWGGFGEAVWTAGPTRGGAGEESGRF